MTPAPTTSPAFSLRQLGALFAYTRNHKKYYAAYLFFLVFQVASFQLLTYSLKYLINTLFPLKQVQPLLLFALGWVGLFSVHMLITFTAAWHTTPRNSGT